MTKNIYRSLLCFSVLALFACGGTGENSNPNTSVNSSTTLDPNTSTGSSTESLDSSIGDSSQGSSSTSTKYRYTDFTQEEKDLFLSSFNDIPPFMATNEYYVDNYIDEYGTINYYTFDNTKSDFNDYLKRFEKYTFDGTFEDEYGITWNVYYQDALTFEVAFYENTDEYNDTYNVMDLYMYLYDDTGGGSTTPETPSNLITNAGKGLPSGVNDIYSVDFTKATHVKDVHDQGYYLGGCPTVGDVNVLVIPLEFTDVTASSKGYTIDTINKAFNADINDTSLPYPSVSAYYQESSYQQLKLNFDVLPTWQKASKASSYYLAQNEDNNVDQEVIDEVLTKLSSTMDLSKYDSDKNGTIDAVVVVNTLDIDDSEGGNILQWAYRYWNMSQNPSEYDGVYFNDYLWASYQFLNETSTGFDGNKANNTYTFIHEFGHVLGADDYYDTSYSDLENHGLAGYDEMDSAFGDHNPYTKFNYGWIKTSKLVTTTTSITVTLNDFSKNGDTLILANNFDPSLGAYQEYYALMYYTNNGLNGYTDGYFPTSGILMYHIDSSLYTETQQGMTYYDVYNNNTVSGEYATENNLIEFVWNQETPLFTQGDTSKNLSITDNNGDALGFTFTVQTLDADTATIVVSKK